MASSSLFTVDGTVLVREPVALPPGAVVSVKLVDADGEVLSATSVEATQGSTTFSLFVDPDDVSDPRRLYLWAKLRSDAGIWGTTELVHIRQDDASDSTDVVVTRIDG